VLAADACGRQCQVRSDLPRYMCPPGFDGRSSRDFDLLRAARPPRCNLAVQHTSLRRVRSCLLLRRSRSRFSSPTPAAELTCGPHAAPGREIELWRGALPFTIMRRVVARIMHTLRLDGGLSLISCSVCQAPVRELTERYFIATCDRGSLAGSRNERFHRKGPVSGRRPCGRGGNGTRRASCTRRPFATARVALLASIPRCTRPLSGSRIGESARGMRDPRAQTPSRAEYLVGTELRARTPSPTEDRSPYCESADGMRNVPSHRR
jgi:hypothetical protein